MASITSSTAGSTATSRTKAITAIVLLLTLLGFGAAWLLGWFRPATDPRVAEILQMQEDARRKFVATGGPSTLVEATEAVATMAQIRRRVEDLPKHLRPEVERQGQGVFATAMRARIDRYFALPPEQRVAELDRQIRQEEMMRKAWEAGGAVMSAMTGGRRDGSGGGSRPAENGGSRGDGQGNGQGGGQNAGQAAAAGTGGTGGPRGFGGGPSTMRTEDDRNTWRKGMIDRTTPEQRARYSEYRRVMNERRTQLGLPTFGPR